MSNIGVKAIGVKTPIIKEGDDVVKIVVDSVLDATRKTYADDNEYYYDINDRDVIGITESVVARSAGLYVTVDEIANDIKLKFGKNAVIILNSMIYSRNRFSMILKGIARGAKKLYLDMPDFDEVGNPSGVNPFTGVNMKEYYREIVEGEWCECVIVNDEVVYDATGTIYCGLHDYRQKHGFANNEGDLMFYTLADICSDKNPDFGLLGTNKATEEKLKLFPTRKLAEDVCYWVKKKIMETTGKDVEAMVYADGCFKSPEISGMVGSSIWEFADPVTSPGYTNGLSGKPNEIKIKAFADDKYKNLSGKELDDAVKSEIKSASSNLVGNMASQGTTPRRYVDLLASLMDLTSGSGDKGTPVILIQNYFNKFSD